MGNHFATLLKGRFRNFRIARFILYITSFWFISIFLAPLTLEPHTVEELDGRANWVDYKDEWMDMAGYNPYAATIYLFGDFNCHQIASRSQSFHDNQLPVCARDVGIAFGAVIGSLALFFVIRTPYVFLTFLSILPERQRTPLLDRFPPWFAAALIALPFLLPTGIDGFYQLLTSYESTNGVRLVTGFFLGILLSWGIGSAFLSITVPLPPLYPYPEGPQECFPDLQSHPSDTVSHDPPATSTTPLSSTPSTAPSSPPPSSTLSSSTPSTSPSSPPPSSTLSSSTSSTALSSSANST